MTRYVVPLTAEPQTFAITLAGHQYTLTLRWCTAAAGGGNPNDGSSAAEGGWMLDIADTDNSAVLVAGIMLVTGADLLAPYPDLGIGGMLWLYSVDELPPGYDDLGTAVDLIFETDEVSS